MPVPALFLAILAAAADAPAIPITVVGHPWAPFISPMGEPFRSHAPGDDTFADWFRQADRNGDGMLTPDEMRADADRFFAALDINHDGQIDPEELIRYEWEVAPEIQVNSRLRHPRGEAPARGGSGEARERVSYLDRGPQGAARYALLNIPEPVAAADADFNRAISLAEFRQAATARFGLLDSQRAGRLTQAELALLLPKVPGGKAKRPRDDADTRVGIPFPPGN